MKLQKRFLRKYNDKDYFKFMVNIPPEVIEKAQLKEGDELKVRVKDSKIILEKEDRDFGVKEQRYICLWSA